MRPPTQVQAIVYCFADDGPQILALHRTPARGGYWQTITGSREKLDLDDGGTMDREVEEQIGVRYYETVAHRLKYEATFTNDHGQEIIESAYGVCIHAEQPIELSDEHDDYRWGTPEEIRELFKLDSNKKVLDVLMAALNRTPGKSTEKP